MITITKTFAYTCGLSIIFLSAIACKTSNDQSNFTSDLPSGTTSYRPTILPIDTTQLWHNTDSLFREIVIIDCPGGPDSILEKITRDRSRYRYLSDYDRYSIFSLYQAQSFNPSMYAYKEEFTLDDAKYEVDISSEMLLRAISYFKSRGKTVYVAGASYGAFVIQHYLMTRPSLADKYILMSGRLDMDQIMVDETMQAIVGASQKTASPIFPNKHLIDIQAKDLETAKIWLQID